MPGRRTAAARKIQRTFRRRPRRKMRPRLPPVGMPTKKIVRLRYCDDIVMDPVAGGLNVYNFSANGMYDPDITAALGHQPLYFDQYMANYDHFCVIGAKIKVTCIPTGNGDSSSRVPGAFGINLSDDSTFSYTSFAQIVESNQNRGHYRSYNNVLTGANTSGRRPSITRKFSAKKFFNNALADSNKGTVASNPSDQAYFQVWAASVDANNPSRTAFLVELEYIAILSEPKFINRS